VNEWENEWECMSEELPSSPVPSGAGPTPAL
jgi:hypothetical protein